MSDWIEPTTLTGHHATLEPLAKAHAPALAEAARDGRLWELWYTFVPAPDAVEDYIADALSAPGLPFAVRHRDSNTVIGSTRFFHPDSANRRLEIGHTWYAAGFQRTPVNTECKRLMLGHAFETLEAIAVEFRTHWFNHASRVAIARLGAKEDGVLRNHQIDAEGAYRDTVVFSILESEWPAVRRNLDFYLARDRD